MTKLLEQALEAVRALPPEAQNDIARVMLTLVADEGTQEGIDPAHLPDMFKNLTQAKRREFASDAESKPSSAASKNEVEPHASQQPIQRIERAEA